MRKEQVTPKQWKKCMRNTDNEKDLVNFLLRDWSTNERQIPILEGNYMHMTIRDRAYCTYSNQEILSCGHVPQLSSSQEEDDTKMVLYAQFEASLGFQSVKIITVDSDIAILALYFQPIFADFNIYSEIGFGTKVKLFDIKSNTLSDDIAMAFPCIHALSGCDSTSTTTGIGKVNMLNAVCKDERFASAAALMGETLDLSINVVVLEKLFCSLHGLKEEISINEAH